MATQGRSFYILDDMPLLYQLTDSVKTETAHLFTAEGYLSLRRRAGAEAADAGAAPGVGENPPGGVVVHYWLKDRPQGDVMLEFLDAAGKLVRKFSSREAPPPSARACRGRGGEPVPRRSAAARRGAGRA